MQRTAVARLSSRLCLVDIAAVLLFAGLTALGSRLVISLPGTPVPLTMQVVPVLLSGLLLGARRGAASQLAFLAGVAAGLPLDARMAGIAALAGPTGGYLAGFVAGAAAAGFLAGRLPPRFPWHFLAACASVLCIYTAGVARLAIYLAIDLRTAATMGAAPFVVPDLAKAVLAAYLATRLSGPRRTGPTPIPPGGAAC